MCMRERQPLPDAIRNAPELGLGLDFFYQAFLDLNRDRTGMGDGPIAWTTIEEYGRLSGLDEDDRDDLHFFVELLDSEFRGFWKDQEPGGVSR